MTRPEKLWHHVSPVNYFYSFCSYVRLCMLKQHGHCNNVSIMHWNIIWKVKNLTWAHKAQTSGRPKPRRFSELKRKRLQNYYYGRSDDPYTNAYTTHRFVLIHFNLNSSISLFEGLQLQIHWNKVNFHIWAVSMNWRKLKWYFSQCCERIPPGIVYKRNSFIYFESGWCFPRVQRK